MSSFCENLCTCAVSLLLEGPPLGSRYPGRGTTWVPSRVRGTAWAERGRSAQSSGVRGQVPRRWRGRCLAPGCWGQGHGKKASTLRGASGARRLRVPRSPRPASDWHSATQVREQHAELRRPARGLSHSGARGVRGRVGGAADRPALGIPARQQRLRHRPGQTPGPAGAVRQAQQPRPASLPSALEGEAPEDSPPLLHHRLGRHR